MDLSDLYQELILDHNRHPRNRRRIASADRRAEGHNPLCGDQVSIELIVRDGVIEDAAFEGQGCAISTASASLMTEAVKGRSLAEAEALFVRFHGLVTDDRASEDGLGKLGAFAGVRRYPARVKCAILAWHTMIAALEGGHQTVSTE
jgi:nitrogen fixation NifU-like protein